MFSGEKRQILRNNQLSEVICQLRFPQILMIDQQPPAAFQEQIRQEFPQYTVRKELPAPKITGTPGNMKLENQAPTLNYQFVSADGLWRVNLTSTFISLACKHYIRWEEFANMLDKPLAAFIQTYKPAFFQRVGLRYLNFISRKSLNLEGMPFRDLIESTYLGPLALDGVRERDALRCNVDAQLQIHGGCQVKIHAGPGLVKSGNSMDKEVRFIFDQDLFMNGNIAVSYCAGALETLHSQAYPIFRSAITDTLLDAMDPADH